MAKKTTEQLPKANILTNKQLQILRDISADLMKIRGILADLEGVEDISTIMFKVGILYNVADKAETIMDELVDSYNEDCDECDDNY